MCVCVCRPSVLDSFSSLSGHTSNLMKQLNNDRLPPLHTRVILPLMVSSDKDFELEVIVLQASRGVACETTFPLENLKFWPHLFIEVIVYSL